MTLDELNKQIESNKIYQFMLRHKKVINIIQGIVIILLLISVDNYVIKDHYIKKQIVEKCGYRDSKFKCICTQDYVDSFESLQGSKINLTFNPDAVINP